MIVIQDGGDDKDAGKGRHNLAADGQILKPAHVLLPLGLWLGAGIDKAVGGRLSVPFRDVSLCVERYENRES